MGSQNTEIREKEEAGSNSSHVSDKTLIRHDLT